MSKIFALYRGLLYTLIVAYLLVAVLPMAFGFQPYIVLSASMEPTIMTGSLSYIDKKDSDVSIDDIVAFSVDDEVTVIHRIVDVADNGQYVTKGDNNESTDIATLSPDQIVGKVKHSISYLGYITKWLQSKKGLITAGVAILIAFISSFFADEEDAKEKKKGKKVKESTSEQGTAEVNSVNTAAPQNDDFDDIPVVEIDNTDTKE